MARYGVLVIPTRASPTTRTSASAARSARSRSRAAFRAPRGRRAAPIDPRCSMPATSTRNGAISPLRLRRLQARPGRPSGSTPTAPFHAMPDQVVAAGSATRPPAAPRPGRRHAASPTRLPRHGTTCPPRRRRRVAGARRRPRRLGKAAAAPVCKGEITPENAPRHTRSPPVAPPALSERCPCGRTALYVGGHCVGVAGCEADAGPRARPSTSIADAPRRTSFRLPAHPWRRTHPG
jgi:hypothetical protein